MYLFPNIGKKVLYGKVREDVREIISILCKYRNVEIIAGVVCIDHVHLGVAVPPKISISNFMEYLKGKSTLMIYDRHLPRFAGLPLFPVLSGGKSYKAESQRALQITSRLS